MSDNSRPTVTAKEIEECRQAAERGNVESQYRMAAYCEWGLGVPQDLDTCAMWCRRAAEQGDARAQYNLAVFYSKGQGVEASPEESAAWYRKAADQGHVRAMLQLARRYEFGDGLPLDPYMGWGWYRKAAEKGDAYAMYWLALHFEKGDGTPMDPKESADLQREASGQDGEAQFRLGVHYEYGQGMPEDRLLAALWFERAAASGIKEAAEHLEACRRLPVKRSEEALRTEQDLQEFREECMAYYSGLVMPPCPTCASADTAIVICGWVSTTIYLASHLQNIHLLPGNPPGRYFCRSCRTYFGLFDHGKP